MTHWTTWPGGDCPVDPETLLDVKWNNGAVSHAVLARIFAEGEVDLWKSRERGGHIVAYRPAQPRPQAPPTFGKYGLPEIDEYAIEALAGCLERLWAGGGVGPIYTVAIEKKRLRHALAAFLMRATTQRDAQGRDSDRDREAAEPGTGSVPEGDRARAAESGIAPPAQPSSIIET